MCVYALGQTFGTIGGGCGEHEVLRKALEVLSDKKDMFLSVDMTNDFAGEEGMVCGGTMDVIIRYVPGKVKKKPFTFPIYKQVFPTVHILSYKKILSHRGILLTVFRAIRLHSNGHFS